MKIVLLAGVAAVLAVGIPAVVKSDDPTPEAIWLDGRSGPWTTNSKALDRKVLALQPGASIEAVRSKLGNPASVIAAEGQVVLLYGTWRLAFYDEGLESRTREYRPGRWSTNEKGLNRKVLKLELGTPIEVIRSEFGKPEAYEIFSNPPSREESLHYGRWKFDFTDGILEGRYKH